MADASLKHSVKLSLFPAAGVVAGGGLVTATMTVQTAPAADPRLRDLSTGLYANLPSTVTIPAGATGARSQPTRPRPVRTHGRGVRG